MRTNELIILSGSGTRLGAQWLGHQGQVLSWSSERDEDISVVTWQTTCMWANPVWPEPREGAAGGVSGLGRALRPVLSQVCGWARNWAHRPLASSNKVGRPYPKVVPHGHWAIVEHLGAHSACRRACGVHSHPWSPGPLSRSSWEGDPRLVLVWETVFPVPKTRGSAMCPKCFWAIHVPHHPHIQRSESPTLGLPSPGFGPK